jgi:hypothetical protein
LEAVESLRLLSSASAGAMFPGLAAVHDLPADPGPAAPTSVARSAAISNATWNAALVQTQLAELRSGVGPTTANPTRTAASTIDPTSLSSGLTQLNKYLSRAWYRAGIPVRMHEDSTQAVFATMLQQMGRHRFDALVSDVGHSGIKDVLGRETDEGLDFFRAVDMVKKRSRRERIFQPLESADVPESSGHSEVWTRCEALREAIDHSLSRRDAGLINGTLMGKTPAEIARHRGVTPKTISNEKASAIQKLREALLAREAE